MIIAAPYSLRSDELLQKLQTLNDVHAVYDCIGEAIAEIDSKLVCIVVQNDEISNKGIVGGLYGLNEKWFLRLINVLGMNPVGRVYEKTEESEKYFYTDTTAREFKGGIYEFAGGQVLRWVSLSIERIFGIGRIFTIALNHDDVPLGTLLLFERNTLGVEQLAAIENVGSVASRKLLEIRNEKLGLASRNYFAESLISQVNHEIRTPLNGILGLMGEVVDRSNESGRSSEIMNDLVDCADQLQRTVDNLILVSNLRSERVNFQFQRTSAQQICEWIQLIVESYEEKFPNRSIIFKCPILSNSHCISADSKYLKIAISELIHNALKFSEKEIRIRASLHGTWLMVEVEDFGVGVAANRVNEIFGLFHQIEGENRLRRGSGIGLSIVKNIADTHGFELNLVKTSPQGSVFALKMSLKNCWNYFWDIE